MEDFLFTGNGSLMVSKKKGAGGMMSNKMDKEKGQKLDKGNRNTSD